MRKHFFLLAFTLVFSFSVIKGENNHAHDYIVSGYYQLIYKAEIAYLEGDYDLAFALLQEAESRVPLINQRTYREIDLYIWLLIKNGQYDKAIYYMEHLAVSYGHFSLSEAISPIRPSLLSRLEKPVGGISFHQKMIVKSCTSIK